MASAVLSPEAPSSFLVRALTGWGGRGEALARTKGCPVLALRGGRVWGGGGGGGGGGRGGGRGGAGGGGGGGGGGRGCFWT